VAAAVAVFGLGDSSGGLFRALVAASRVQQASGSQIANCKSLAWTWQRGADGLVGSHQLVALELAQAPRHLSALAERVKWGLRIRLGGIRGSPMGW
jgi:hypothetical protein